MEREFLGSDGSAGSHHSAVRPEKEQQRQQLQRQPYLDLHSPSSTVFLHCFVELLPVTQALSSSGKYTHLFFLFVFFTPVSGNGEKKREKHQLSVPFSFLISSMNLWDLHTAVWLYLCCMVLSSHFVSLTTKARWHLGCLHLEMFSHIHQNVRGELVYTREFVGVCEVKLRTRVTLWILCKSMLWVKVGVFVWMRKRFCGYIWGKIKCECFCSNASAFCGCIWGIIVTVSLFLWMWEHLWAYLSISVRGNIVNASDFVWTREHFLVVCMR